MQLKWLTTKEGHSKFDAKNLMSQHQKSHVTHTFLKQNWFLISHLIKTAIAYLQMPSNFLPILPQQVRTQI